MMSEAQAILFCIMCVLIIWLVPHRPDDVEYDEVGQALRPFAIVVLLAIIVYFLAINSEEVFECLSGNLARCNF